jgi:hypothetical protein
MLNDFIGFTYNWNNKLNCKAFTTIRLRNPSKYILNNTYRIELKGDEIGTAKLVAMHDFYLKDLSETVSLIDTGYSKKEATDIILKMYPETDFAVTRLSLITLAMEKKPQQPNTNAPVKQAQLPAA